MTLRWAALAVVLTFTSAAAAPEVGQNIVISDGDAARLLIANDRLDEAGKVLDHALAAQPDSSDLLFLRATVAVAQKDYDTAISLFRRILVREPDAERVRLELARAFFLKGDYDNADRQFRFARAGDVPDEAKRNIDQYLSAINRLREWTVDFAVALAPDTNQNAATSISQISIFGLPFTLDRNARRQSGVGLAGDVGGEWSPILFDNVKARIGADLYRAEYSGGQFDDMTLSEYAGPQWLFPDWDVSLLATGVERWYGNRSFLRGLGGKIAAEYGITSDVLVGASFGAQELDDLLLPDQSGPLWSSQGQATWVVSPSTLFQFRLGFDRQDARIGPLSYSSVWVGAGYQQDLPFGFSAGIQPSYYMTRYDDVLPAFGVVRRDHALVLGFSLLNRRFDYHGFTPRLSYVITGQHSNIPLYGYSRNQIQIGVTSEF